jgi:uncharacterized membrane protein
MEENQNRIAELLNKINQLSNRHDSLKEEIDGLKRAIYQISQGEAPTEKVEQAFPKITNPQSVVVHDIAESSKPTPLKEKINLPPFIPAKKAVPTGSQENGKWEEFIGTNLLNKVGIAILVLGISFGVKYAIDHQMLNPLTRIILGYLAGASIIAFALKLKKNYEAFSAVLLGGGMAALYFITYVAYNSYGFIPQAAAFVLMVAFTAFTVFAAMNYNLQVIAVIGLVGAYAVPFMLSDGSGRVVILFSYMMIINAGILVISFMRKWNVLFTVAFSLTWMIFTFWIFDDYQREEHFWLALLFATFFFIIFYISFLVGKFINRVKLSIPDIVVVLLNCFIYYGLGYYLINNYPDGELYLGLFTVANAVIHFLVCVFVYKKLGESKDTFYFVAGLVLVFITMAVPVQLEGNWVTLVWALEACLLLWIGRSKQYPVYELLSYPLAALAFFSLLHDWQVVQESYYNYYSEESPRRITPFFNINFLTSLLVAGMFGFFVWFSSKIKTTSTNGWLAILIPALRYILPVIGLLVLYTCIYQNIGLFFTNQYLASAINIRSQGIVEYNSDWLSYQTLWLINYSIFFFACLWLINQRFIKNDLLNKIVVGINTLLIITFLLGGLNALENLRYTFLSPSKFYVSGVTNLLMRYIGYAFVAVLLYINYRFSKTSNATIQKLERLFCHFTMLTILSSELLSILELSGVTNGYKLALSILWGAYALYLIIWGFAKDHAYLRIAGIGLFAITLLKLFFYDMADMEAIAKTIVLMILGVLLLVASFVYNKRKKKESSELPIDTNTDEKIV